MDDAWEKLELWRLDYNSRKPKSALEGLTPMSIQQATVWRRNMYVETTIPEPATVYLFGKAHNHGNVAF